jgi:hypothetical protein
MVSNRARRAAGNAVFAQLGDRIPDPGLMYPFSKEELPPAVSIPSFVL